MRISRTTSNHGPRKLAVPSLPMKVPAFVLACLAFFWIGMLLAATQNPSYSLVRDYVSTLAAHGAEHAWLGVLAISAAGAGIGAAALLLRPLSRIAAAAAAGSGICVLVVAFTQLDCPNGAAGCGLGGRFDVSGFHEVTHSLALTVSATLLVCAMVATGIALWRHGRSIPAVATLAAATATAAAFLATGGDSPGWIERLGIAVATVWLSAMAIAALRRDAGRATGSRTS
jgi:hypothetical membrane protein